MHMSWNPISSTIIKACRHALASTITGPEMFSYGLLHVGPVTPKTRKTCCVKVQTLKRWSTDSFSVWHTGHKVLITRLRIFRLCKVC
ncbi:hypothetical protein ES319_A09G195800v1 [Gossypium barbadense]|uniref:Uncharacterized protein n=2 Tax=Gossypium TaxID=3633 RepID=A0A5J5UHR4_GOSBA|nr:hypothetical protein ES319_A09G195800v1 [Gossypium barbadense]TYI11548.1 hypothetical protein ES332_A09G214900v1 [Gossypium tomentosum]